jgi:Tfp pilus assembly protein PilF
MAEPQSDSFCDGNGGTIAHLARRWKPGLTALFLIVMEPVQPVAAADAPSPAMTERIARNRYDHCVALVQQDPAAAAKNGADWFAGGGGAPALQCEALALVALKRYGDAAAKLDEAGSDKSVSDVAMRAALLDQAGNAWLLAGQAGKAEASLTLALSLAPKDQDILADRARARGLRKDWKDAEADLTAVLAADPNRADIYVLRASARHAEGRKADARADLVQAFNIYPNYPEALVERGTIEFEGGDIAGARADWQLAAKEAPDSDAGASARERLQAITVPAKPPARR